MWKSKCCPNQAGNCPEGRILFNEFNENNEVSQRIDFLSVNSDL